MESTQTDVKEYKYFAGNQWRKAVDSSTTQNTKVTQSRTIIRLFSQ